MHLLLLSWGVGALPSQLPPGSRLGYIPTAAEPYADRSFADEMRGRLVALGYVPEDIELSTMPPAEIEAAIGRSDALFMSGGNTFYLLQKLLETGADRMVRAHVAAGKLYVGASAGSCLAAPDIAAISIFDDPAAAPGLTTTKGFGFVDYLIIPHIDSAIPETAETLERLERKYGGTIPMLHLRDDEAVLARSRDDRTIVPSP